MKHLRIADVGIFTNSTELGLLWWLRDRSTGYRAAIEAAGLGIQSYHSVALLQELSERDDIGAAHANSGLGAGYDFDCAEDESPRDAGCQIKCESWECKRAAVLCRAIKQCIKSEPNQDRSWTTLKSREVPVPSSIAICDGFAFSADGTPPMPVATPAVSFDVLRPNESWCYRDTSFNTAAHASFRQHRPGNACTMRSCFDLRRCAADIDTTCGPSIYMSLDKPRSHDVKRWPSCMRGCHQAHLVDHPTRACLVIPTINLNCEWDKCDQQTAQKLRGLPSWSDGSNHLIWDYNDLRRLTFDTDKAVYLKSSLDIDDYRSGFDVPFPLLPNGAATHATTDQLSATASKRDVLLSFMGLCQPRSHRPALARLHNNADVIAVCSGTPRAAQYDYKQLMLRSLFAAAPGGNGLHSYRLTEAIFLGAIPVIVDEKLTLPFCSVLDWRYFSVRGASCATHAAYLRASCLRILACHACYSAQATQSYAHPAILHIESAHVILRMLHAACT